jgi:hypothetical protein
LPKVVVPEPLVCGERFEPTAWLFEVDGLVIVELPDAPTDALPDVQGKPLVPTRPFEVGLVVLPWTPGVVDVPGVIVVPGLGVLGLGVALGLVVVAGLIVELLGEVAPLPVVPMLPLVPLPAEPLLLAPELPPEAPPPEPPPPAARTRLVLPSRAMAASTAIECLVCGICDSFASPVAEPTPCDRQSSCLRAPQGRPFHAPRIKRTRIAILMASCG